MSHSKGSSTFEEPVSKQTIQSLDSMISAAQAFESTNELDSCIEQYSLAVDALDEVSCFVHNEPSSGVFNEQVYAVRYNRGRVYERSGKIVEALVDLNAAIKLMPNRVPALCLRSIIKQRNGDYEKALEDLETAASLEPNSTDVLLIRAVCLHCMNRMADAVFTCSIILEKDPKCVLALLLRGDSLKFWTATSAPFSLSASSATHNISITTYITSSASRSRDSLMDYQKALSIDAKNVKDMIGRGFSWKQSPDNIMKLLNLYASNTLSISPRMSELFHFPFSRPPPLPPSPPKFVANIPLNVYDRFPVLQSNLNQQQEAEEEPKKSSSKPSSAHKKPHPPSSASSTKKIVFYTKTSRTTVNVVLNEKLPWKSGDVHRNYNRPWLQAPSSSHPPALTAALSAPPPAASSSTPAKPSISAPVVPLPSSLSSSSSSSAFASISASASISVKLSASSLSSAAPPPASSAPGVASNPRHRQYQPKTSPSISVSSPPIPQQPAVASSSAPLVPHPPKEKSPNLKPQKEESPSIDSAEPISLLDSDSARLVLLSKPNHQSLPSSSKATPQKKSHSPSMFAMKSPSPLPSSSPSFSSLSQYVSSPTIGPKSHTQPHIPKKKSHNMMASSSSSLVPSEKDLEQRENLKAFGSNSRNDFLDLKGPLDANSIEQQRQQPVAIANSDEEVPDSAESGASSRLDDNDVEKEQNKDLDVPKTPKSSSFRNRRARVSSSSAASVASSTTLYSHVQATPSVSSSSRKLALANSGLSGPAKLSITSSRTHLGERVSFYEGNSINASDEDIPGFSKDYLDASLGSIEPTFRPRPATGIFSQTLNSSGIMNGSNANAAAAAAVGGRVIRDHLDSPSSNGNIFSVTVLPSLQKKESKHKKKGNGDVSLKKKLPEKPEDSMVRQGSLKTTVLLAAVHLEEFQKAQSAGAITPLAPGQELLDTLRMMNHANLGIKNKAGRHQSLNILSGTNNGAGMAVPLSKTLAEPMR